jgi:hypothetical protein
VLAVALQLERALEAPRRLLEGSGRQMRIGEAEPGKAEHGHVGDRALEAGQRLVVPPRLRVQAGENKGG